MNNQSIQRLLSPSSLLTSIIAFLMLMSSSFLVLASNLPNFTDLVENHKDAVVNIGTTRTITQNPGGFGRSPFGQEIPGPFRDFFKHYFGEEFEDGFEQMPEPREFESESLGSGFIISDDGYIVTNNHVVSDADKILVTLTDRTVFEAELVAKDPDTDLALLKIDANKKLSYLEFGDSDELKVGEWVLAIGSPFGFEQTVTSGIISAKSRTLGISEKYVPFLQSDVAINPGSSGGPLFNMDGDVIGINSQIVSRSGGYLGLSFSVPSNTAKYVILQLKEQGFVSRGWLGVSFQAVGPDLAKAFGLKSADGALVSGVLPDSPASDAGFEVGDVIVEFDGRSVQQHDSLPPLVGAVKPGETIKVIVIRDKKEKTLKVKIGELESEQVVASLDDDAFNEEDKSPNSLGITVADITKEQSAEWALDMKGVLIDKVYKDTPASKVGLRVGDILFSLNQQQIKNTKDFDKAIDSLPKSGSVAALIGRDGMQGGAFIAIDLD